MACGVKVVASAVAGIPDVIRDGRNGWLCREQDACDLASKLTVALTISPDSPVMAAARKTAEEYDWQQVAKNYMSCLTAHLSNPQLAN
jgi:glycosyltransferase involved in cell wall biosynthesis